MLHALLRHKFEETTPESERLEDAVTSTVFGTLVMVEAWDVLGTWLRLPPELALSGADSERDCWFWPQLGVVPDVVLRLGRALVLVEAKYYSGRNDPRRDDEELAAVASAAPHPGSADVAGAHVAHKTSARDQLVSQYEAMIRRRERRMLYPEPIERAIRECELLQVYLVNGARRSRANREFAESKARLPDGARLALVTWQSLCRLLGDSRRWQKDLKAYLMQRNLDGFDGFGHWEPNVSEVRQVDRWRPRRIVRAWGETVGIIGRADVQAIRSWRLNGTTTGARWSRRLAFDAGPILGWREMHGKLERGEADE